MQTLVLARLLKYEYILNFFNKPLCYVTEWNFLVISMHIGTYVPILKDGYLDFSHLTELKNIYITEIYTRKQYKSRIKNHKITNKKKF